MVTEAMHLLGGNPEVAESIVRFLQKNRVRISACADWPALERAVFLMQKYSDTPMDFADATLVWLAEDSRAHEILTVDERGFRTFRIHGRTAFKLVLDDYKK